MPEDDKISETNPAVPSVLDDIVPDAEVVAEPKEQSVSGPPTPPVAPRRATGFFPLAFGGVVAAAAGFGIAQFVPQGWPITSTDSLRQEVAGQAAEIASLKSALDDLAAKPIPDVSGEISAVRAEVEQRFSALPQVADPGAEIAALRASVDDAMAGLDARLSQVEKAPSGTAGGASATAIAAFERDLQVLRAQVEQLGSSGGAATDEINQAVATAKAELAAAAQGAEKLKVDVAAAARAARLDAALARIEASLEAGGPFSSAIADLTEAGVNVPSALVSSAASGVETLPDLQRRFPAFARAGLEAALRANVGEGWGERLSAFLRTQTGARSLEPREGGDPDAVLSRAEAALDEGDLSTALTEMSTLPDVAKAEMTDWIAAADQRQQAEAAVATVAAAVDTQ